MRENQKKGFQVKWMLLFHDTQPSTEKLRLKISRNQASGKIGSTIGLFFLCAMVVFTGCGQDRRVSSPQSADQSNKKISLKVFCSGENVNWVAAIENLGDIFMREHSDIELEFENTGTGIYTEALKVKEATDEFPDILEIQDPYTFQKAGKLGEIPLSVSNLVDRPVTINGKVYAVPLYSTTEGIIYNQVLLNRYKLSEPKTYQEFLGLCRQLKSVGVTPLAIGGNNSKSLNCWLNYFFQTDVIAKIPDWQNKRDHKEVSFQDPQPVQMLQDYRALMSSPYILEDSVDMNDNQLVSKLIDGQFAMMYTDPSLLPQIIDAYPAAAEPAQSTGSGTASGSQTKCRVGWFFLPDQHGNPIAVSRIGAQWAISSDCAKNTGKKGAAAQFFEYLLSADHYRKALQVMYAVPSTKTAILYPAAGVQQRLLVSYRYAAKSEAYFGNNETPEWFTQSIDSILKSIATNAISVKGAAKKLDTIWDHNEN
jgi:ABC-type glycerol-3-phosphate transport system substrate-binding protein